MLFSRKHPKKCCCLTWGVAFIAVALNRDVSLLLERIIHSTAVFKPNDLVLKTSRQMKKEKKTGPSQNRLKIFGFEFQYQSQYLSCEYGSFDQTPSGVPRRSSVELHW